MLSHCLGCASCDVSTFIPVLVARRTHCSMQIFFLKVFKLQRPPLCNLGISRLLYHYIVVMVLVFNLVKLVHDKPKRHQSRTWASRCDIIFVSAANRGVPVRYFVALTLAPVWKQDWNIVSRDLSGNQVKSAVHVYTYAKCFANCSVCVIKCRAVREEQERRDNCINGLGARRHRSKKWVEKKL